MNSKSNFYALFVSFSLFGYVLVAAISNILFKPDVSSPLAVLYRLIIVVFSVLYLFFNINDKSGENKIQKSSYYIFIVFIFFWFFYFIRLIFDFNMSDLYISEDVKKEYILFSFGVCFIPALALARALKPNELHNILLYSYYILLFGVCISLYFAIKDYMLGIQIESSRLALTRLSPIQLGKYSVFLCIISYGLLLHKNKTKKISFLFLLCSITLGVVTIVLSGSRTAFVGLVLICLLNLFLRISITKILMILILLPVFAYISLTAVSYVIPELDIVDKYLSMGDVNDQSANIRYELYHGALQQFSTSPLFGDFFLEREYMYAPHNLTLEVMMSLGVLGLIAFISIVLFSLVKLLVLIKVSGKNESSLYMTCFNLLAYLLIASNFSLGITTASEIWALCILSLFLLTSKSTVKFSENKTY